MSFVISSCYSTLALIPSKLELSLRIANKWTRLVNLSKANDLCSFKVGSVEEFQGQERDVIIVSTVRSHESFIDGDVIQHLGFLRSPKRFNVTVTRAKSLLIVIGNPHLLTNDEHWGPFLKHCVQLGAYTGCDLPEM